MDFEELKNILTQYGEKLDDDDIEIFEQALKVNDGKIIVDGKFYLFMIKFWVNCLSVYWKCTSICRVYNNAFSLGDQH